MTLNQIILGKESLKENFTHPARKTENTLNIFYFEQFSF